MGYKCKEICCLQVSDVSKVSCVDTFVVCVLEDKEFVGFKVLDLNDLCVKVCEILLHDSASPDRISHCSGS